VDEYIELTKLTDELGWYSVNIGDGLFFFDETSVDYPYSDDGARYWSGDTPFPDPFAINPVPRTHLPIFVGGTATPVLERAAKLADGFVSPNTTAAEIGHFAREIHDYRKEYGTDGKPFEMISVAIDTFDFDGHRRLAEMGVTEACVVPWFFYGGSFHSPLEFKKDAVKRFTDQVISKM